jgi:hypothetical protein
MYLCCFNTVTCLGNPLQRRLTDKTRRRQSSASTMKGSGLGADFEVSILEDAGVRSVPCAIGWYSS